jgi:hypothetical protein
MAKKTKKSKKAAATPHLDLLKVLVKQTELNAQMLDALSVQLAALAQEVYLLTQKTPAKLLTEPTNPASNLME